MHGTGTHNYANGNKYTGDWIEGEQTGHGVFTWANGDQYEGEFDKGIRTGYGVATFLNRGRYEMRYSQISRDQIFRYGMMYYDAVNAMKE
jgi:hypothetical protein